MSIALIAAVGVLDAVKAPAAAANPNLAGTSLSADHEDLPVAAQTFKVAQSGNHSISGTISVNSERPVTSTISIGAGPPWNLPGVISPDGKLISPTAASGA